MADPELVKILQQGSEVWNCWRKQQPEDMSIDLSGVDLSESNLQGVNLRRANLYDANLRETYLHQADLTQALLEDVVLRGTIFQYANLSQARLRRANLKGSDLYRARLSGAILVGATLYRANLSEAILRGAYMSEANLKEVCLVGANLHGAHMQNASILSTDLSKADLRGADLREAELRNTTLYQTNMHGVNLGSTTIAHTDLSSIKGLAEIDHSGPSDIMLHTIQLPQDGSALHFLRGAGIPDEWIDFYRSTMMHPIQYHSCFISYAHQDDDLARRLHSDLQDHGVRCWFAPHDMHIGDKIHRRIDEAIHLQDKLLLILSEHSVASDWVEHEVETALAKERREKRTTLFPIRLDNTILERPYTGWAATIQNERHIGDFTGWKDHDHYQKAFESLLRDLKKAEHHVEPSSDALS